MAKIEIAMPGIVYKLGGAEIHYTITETLDADEARDLLIATAPFSLNSAINSDYNVTERSYGIWDGVADYSIPPDQSTPPPGQEDAKSYKSFTTIGGTAHITQSIKTVNSYCVPCQQSRPGRYVWSTEVDPPAFTAVPTEAAYIHPGDGCTEIAPTYEEEDGETAPLVGESAFGKLVPSSSDPPVAPYFGGAIGVTKDSVEGVDITVPEFKFQGKAYLNDSVVTDAFVQSLYRNTGRVNNAAWKMFSAGEVLFLGATGTREGRGNWEITFEFAASPNVTGLKVGPIEDITKRGWEYLWIRYHDYEDTEAHCLVRRPLAVYVEQVYRYTNFAFLTGIF